VVGWGIFLGLRWGVVVVFARVVGVIVRAAVGLAVGRHRMLLGWTRGGLKGK
jgi:hypothetical protein